MGRKVAAIASALCVAALLFAGLGGALRQDGGAADDAWHDALSSLLAGSEPAADAAEGNGAASEAAGEVSAAAAEGGAEGVYEPGVVLVRLQDGVSVAQFNERLASFDYIATKRVSEDDVALGYVELELADGVSVEDAEKRIAVESVVAAAQPNYRYGLADDVPADPVADDATQLVRAIIAQVTAINDARADEQWALGSVNAYEAWDIVKAGDAGDGRVAVAVIDNGCLVTHEDLKNNIVDSYNAVDGSKDVSPRYGGHGTHVCGIVAAEANNGKGVAGVSYNAGLLPIQVFESSTNATTLTLCKAYEYILEHAEELNIRVVNMSLGATYEESLLDDVALDQDDKAAVDAVTRAYDKGLLTVCSSGNFAGTSGEGLGRAYLNYPSDWLDCVLGVIALDNSGKRASYSNYNMEGQTTKDIAAPGGDYPPSGQSDSSAVSILSTYSNTASTYALSKGTSMASPCVAGVAALAFAANPRLSAADVTQLLCKTAADLGVEGWDAEYGYGEVDAAAAVSKASLCPEGPSELLKGGTAQLTLATGDDWVWSSSDEGVATVDAAGVVTGVGGGTAEITARSGSDGAFVTLPKSITVYDVGFTGSGAVEVGRSIELGFGKNPDSGLWLVASADASVATVSVGDVITVTGVSPGKTSITATLSTSRGLVVEFPLSVEQCSLEADDVSVSLSETSFTYDGSARKPAVAVTVGTRELEENADFTVEYRDNEDAGTARAVIAGQNDYTGTIEATFEILRSPVEAPVSAGSLTYTGKEQTGAIDIVEGAGFGIEGVYKATDAGDYEFTVTPDSNHVWADGSADPRRFAWTIARASLSDAKVTLLASKRAYNGKFQKGSVKSVVLDGVTLGKGDFSVSARSRKAVGKTSVGVVGKGNYTGTATAVFSIVRAAQSISAKNVTVKYAGKKRGKTKVLATTKVVSLKTKARVAAKTAVKFAKANKAGGSKIVVNKRTGKVTVKKGLRKGTYKVKVKLTAASSANYRAAKSKAIVVKVVVK